ncbi:MAG: hypothetical protein GOU98_01230 [Candidatus Altiarchaeota archaeon]|nr:hypothetical protein [Candidatus Altiarchaeota archaeon]
MDEKKIIYLILLAVFAYSLIIPLRLFFEWPLANYWDYASHITGTKIMLENGCNSIGNWTGYNICTKNAPGFFVTSAFFSLFFGIKTGFVLAILFYILLFYQLSTKVFKQDKLVVLSVLGTPFAFWWFFKTGRVLEMTATMFAALFFMTKSKKQKVIFAALSYLHHPTLIIPLILLSGKEIKSAFSGLVLIFPYFIFLIQNAAFTKWVHDTSLVGFFNLFQAAPFLLLSFNFVKIIPLLFSEALICTGTGACFLWIIPILKNTRAASLAPLVIFLVFKKLSEKKQYRKLLIALIISMSLFFSREAYYLLNYGTVDSLLPMESQKIWLDTQLTQLNQTFSYECSKINYPTTMMASSYAYVKFGLNSVKSPFPEFVDTNNLPEICPSCVISCE